MDVGLVALGMIPGTISIINEFSMKLRLFFLLQRVKSSSSNRQPFQYIISRERSIHLVFVIMAIKESNPNLNWVT